MLKIDYCSHEAAKYACEKFHYSKCVPKSKLIKFGVWENQKWIGSIIYGLGANPKLSNILRLKDTECCELVRVALTKHTNPVSKMVAISLKMLKKSNPNLKAVISYADKDQGHEGGIYKASNWLHIGIATAEHISLFGKQTHPKTVYDRYGTSSIPWLQKNVDPNIKKIPTKGKHRYVYWLDKDKRKKEMERASQIKTAISSLEN